MKRLVALLLLASATASADILVSWDYPAAPDHIVFEVWTSPDLIVWWEAAETTGQCYRVRGDEAKQFFKVRARDIRTGLCSEWATVR